MQNVHMQQQEILYFHIYNTHTHFFNVRNLSSTLSASINDPTQCYQLQLPCTTYHAILRPYLVAESLYPFLDQFDKTNC